MDDAPSGISALLNKAQRSAHLDGTALGSHRQRVGRDRERILRAERRVLKAPELARSGHLQTPVKTNFGGLRTAQQPWTDMRCPTASRIIVAA